MRNVLRLHSFATLSRANGPGLRSVVWVQGCSLHCPGCYNPRTHPLEGGHLVCIDEVFSCIAMKQGIIEGVTISGGEPLEQFHPVLALLRRIRQETKLSTVVSTGYTWDEVRQMPEIEDLVSMIDVLITGRYVASLRLAKGLRGSANKTVHVFTTRYTSADLEATPPAEIIVMANGEVVVSGIDPPQVEF